MAQWLPWRKKEPAPEVQVPSVTEAAGKGEKGQQETTLERQASWQRGLSRLRQALVAPLDRLVGGPPLSEEVFTTLEEALLSADVGVQTTTDLISRLRERCRYEESTDAGSLKQYLKEEILAVLQRLKNPSLIGSARPWVILVVGVNGVGKTTSIAKLAARFSREQKKVLLVAADTFRAAAIEQLEVWAGRLSIDLIKHQSGASPAAVAFDGVRAAIARGVDIVIIDTAGRLHTKTPLMEELKKVYRVIAKELPGAPHETLLVLDASTGQNAFLQARTFQQALPLSGAILAKMDGSAKGGVILSVIDGLRVPIRCIGMGEKVEDLQDFAAADFVAALFAPAEISLDI